ncbi:hypothetical protein ACFQ48_05715 [Hymenobacter caeli]|uniref:DUF1735 domain-containing protein n=1 Tax=Hymenobacter caeli TaxID=2735894 RepID=A0ABX2FNT5_9BACT|nr:hypothetical protein [Hymenobacter caeli]NRT18622.1 hypothetical protein [Hymenobacter caeli]
MLPVLAGALLLAGGCKKILGLIHFTVSDTQSFTVPSAYPFGTAPGAVPTTLPAVTVNSTATTTYANNNTKAQYVQDVTLQQLTLTATSPAGQTFDIVQSVQLFISSDAAGTNKVLLASQDQVPAGATSIQLNPAPDTKLDMYLQGSSYALTSVVKLKQQPSQDVVIRVDSKFNVAASLP